MKKGVDIKNKNFTFHSQGIATPQLADRDEVRNNTVYRIDPNLTEVTSIPETTKQVTGNWQPITDCSPPFISKNSRPVDCSLPFISENSRPVDCSLPFFWHGSYFRAYPQIP
jgi:hypothetical protein